MTAVGVPVLLWFIVGVTLSHPDNKPEQTIVFHH